MGIQNGDLGAGAGGGGGEAVPSSSFNGLIIATSRSRF